MIHRLAPVRVRDPRERGDPEPHGGEPPEEGQPEIGEPGAERPTLARRRPQLRMSIVTAVIWVLLWGDLSLANLVSGFLLGLLITEEGALNVDFEDDIVAAACITHGGEIRNERAAK